MRLVEAASINRYSVGLPVGNGIEHHVYEWLDESTFGRPGVIKVPTIAKSKVIRNNVAADLTILTDYFPGRVPATIVRDTPSGNVVLQERLFGARLDVYDEQFRKFLESVAETNKRLHAELGASLDFIRPGLILRGKRSTTDIRNYMYDGESEVENIRIIDTTLLHTDPKYFQPVHPVVGDIRAGTAVHLVERLVNRQAQVLNDAFGVSII